ncbi:MAG: hypothetical protein FJ109_14255 [Deltaproteobacteria bacterium]|nr:hypothetical protein [Deltaproteobacteria bacterium]
MKRLLVLALTGFALAACSSSGKLPVGLLDGNLPDGEVASGDVLSEKDGPSAAEVADATIPPPDGTPEPEAVTEVLPEVAPEIAPPVEIVEEVAPDVPVPPDGGCVDIWNCGLELGCPQKGQTCWEVCKEGATDFAKAEFDAFADCVEKNCSGIPEDQQGDCMWGKCFGELTICLGGTGTADCGETFSCMGGCPKDDGMCVFDCLANASQEAVEVALKMSQGGDKEQFYWLIECLGGQGQADCGETVTCLNGCNKDADDPSCTFACLEATSPETKAQLHEMFGCGEGMCVDKMIECVGGGGDKTCGQVFQCVFDCDKNTPAPPPGEEGPDCMTPCIGQSSPKGAEDLAAMFKCMAEKCPNQQPGQDPCPESLVCFALCPDFPMPQ